MQPNTTPKRPSGRPPTLTKGKRVNLYLDAETLAAALKLGNGNASAGVRIALKAKE
jgi:hypothetical protein